MLPHRALLLLICPVLCFCQRANQVFLTCGANYDDPLQDAVMKLEAKVETMKTELQDTNRAVTQLKARVEELENSLSIASVYSSCKDAFQNGVTRSGVYSFTSPRPYRGYCDMETDGGGWLVIQKRFEGLTDFYRGWMEYDNGFGNLMGEFWIGLQLMHELTSWKQHELRIDLENFNSTKYFAKYSNFDIGSAQSNYSLSVSGYTGNAGDQLNFHNQMAFSTYDRDNDGWHGNCATKYHGAWWYKYCVNSNLNGKYYQEETTAWDSTFWRPVSRKRTEIKIRPVM